MLVISERGQLEQQNSYYGDYMIVHKPNDINVYGAPRSFLIYQSTYHTLKLHSFDHFVERVPFADEQTTIIAVFKVNLK